MSDVSAVFQGPYFATPVAMGRSRSAATMGPLPASSKQSETIGHAYRSASAGSSLTPPFSDNANTASLHHGGLLSADGPRLCNMVG